MVDDAENIINETCRFRTWRMVKKGGSVNRATAVGAGKQVVASSQRDAAQPALQILEYRFCLMDMSHDCT
jgi:hypothetical protein